MATWVPAQQVGHTDGDIPAAKAKLAGNSYGKAIGADRSPAYTEAFGAALRQYGINKHDEVVKGKVAAPDVNTQGIFDWAIKKQMKIGKYAAPVMPPALKIPMYCFRGTGGVIGLDPCSRVAQRLGDDVIEINTPYTPVMGGIPVGATEGGIGAPSMWTSIQEGLAAFQNDFIGRHAVNPKIRVTVLGYSAGAILAALVCDWLRQNYPGALIASASFGDPTRPVGGGFYGRPAPWGRGISSEQHGDPKDYSHCWLTHEGDMYAQVPNGVAGDIMDDVYEQVAQFAFKDIFKVALNMLPLIPSVAQKAGISLPAAFASLAGGPIGLFSFGITQLMAMLPGIIGTGDRDKLTGAAAAGYAARAGIEFLFAGTGPHIRYEFDPAWPGGPTFVDLAAMHFRDYIHRPVAA